MSDSKFEFLPCDGTYFILAKYDNICDFGDKKMAEWLTKEKGVAVIPISVFYSDGTDEKIIRFCFAKKDETLIEAAKKLSAL